MPSFRHLSVGLLTLFTATKVNGQEYLEAVTARCLQQITIVDRAAEAKIRWQHKNCQEIWRQQQEQLDALTREVRQASTPCHEMVRASAIDEATKMRWVSKNCPSFFAR